MNQPFDPPALAPVEHCRARFTTDACVEAASGAFLQWIGGERTMALLMPRDGVYRALITLRLGEALPVPGMDGTSRLG